MPNSEQQPDAREGMISETDHAAALTNARAEGATAERSRIAAILDSEEATPRATLARHLALHTQMTLEEARATLAASSPESDAPDESFAEHKERAANESGPNLSAPAPSDQPSEQRKGLSAAVGRFC